MRGAMGSAEGGDGAIGGGGGGRKRSSRDKCAREGGMMHGKEAARKTYADAARDELLSVLHRPRRRRVADFDLRARKS